MKHTHRLKWWLIGLLAVVVSAFLAAGLYFYNVAVVPGHKNFISNSHVVKKSDSLYRQKTWYLKAKKQKWQMTSADDHLRLVANYIPNKKASNKTAVVLHGYMNSKDNMGAYAYLFNRLGYNVLLPDARGHGQSQGNYIGYGWREKVDVRKWIRKIIAKNPQSQIVVFGVSMGGATTMMTSGLKLPQQVKAFVEDCGYTNAKTEIQHEAQDLYNMPAFPRFPLVEVLSGITRIRAGYFLADASSVNQLAKNHRPMMFIHGSKDTFVPTSMVYENYRASKGKKQLWIVKNASHAQSYATAPKQYEEHVKQFLRKYVK